MTKLARYVAAINSVLPGLEITSARLQEGGQYSDALLINDELVFCFPLYTDLAQEVAILKSLRGRLPLAVPDPIYVHSSSAAQKQPFFSYRRMDGGIVTADQIETTYDAATCDRLAAQIAQFLKALHRHPVRDIGHQLPVHDGPADYAAMYDQIRQRLFSRMRLDARTAVTRLFEDYLVRPSDYSFTPTLRHGDFGISNLLFDHTKAEFIGAIHFGDAALGDPAVDFAGLYAFSEHSARFAVRMFSEYPELEAMTQRMHFHRATFALQEALFGAENGNDQALAAGLAEYV